MMLSKTILLNRIGYEPFFDFVKFYAITCVLIGHVIPASMLNDIGYGLWAGMQVPLFVLIQAFHGLKKEHISFNIKKMMLRIVVPFVFVEILLFSYMALMGNYGISSLFYLFLKNGGMGPGSYFPWIYLQLAFIIPVISPYIRKPFAIWYVLLICEGFEILFSLLDFSESIYRLLCVRYFMLLYLGWRWVKEGIVVNYRTLTFAFISLFTVIYFEYFSVDDEPYFFTTRWKFHRWPCYYYVAVGGGILLYNAYKLMAKMEWLFRVMKLLAKCSYEIFLMQMVIIPIFPKFHFVSDYHLRFGMRVSLIFAISIIGGILYNRYYNILISRIRK